MSQRAKRYIFDGALIIAWCLWLAIMRTFFGVQTGGIIGTIVSLGIGAVIGIAGNKLFPDEVNFE